MARILSEERVVEYSREFKVHIVKLTKLPGVQIKALCECVGLHPFMVSRWRKEYRDGDLTYEPSRKIHMTVKREPPSRKEDVARVRKLERENARLKKENDLLKKWQRYLKEQKLSDSNS